MLRSALSRRVTALAFLSLTGLVGIYLAARAGGAAPAVLAAVAVASGLALVARLEPASTEALSVTRVFDAVLLLLPGALIVYFAFDSGGYFPASTGFGAILLVVVLVLRVTLVEQPFEGFSRPLALAAGAFGLFTLWTLVSAAWSDAPARSLVEFDRAFVYLLLLVICGSVARTSTRLRWMAASIAGATLVVAIGALATRLYPDRFSIHIPRLSENGLAYPLTYTNALGMLSVLGAILCLYFATSVRLPRGVRAAGSAALPILAATVYLTLSRGPVAAAILGIAAFFVLGRPRGLLTGLAATVPTSVIAIASAYQHPLLTGKNPQSAAAAAQGHRVAVVVVLCAAGAALLRLVLSPLDERLAAFSLPDRSRRPVVAAGWAGLVLAVVVVGLAVHAPHRISDQYHRFVSSGQAAPLQDVRQSVFSGANRGLIANWSVGLKAFGDKPLGGFGAGTYELFWYQKRPAKQHAYYVVDGHSLYIETLGELGIIGFLLLLTAIVAILVALVPVGRGANRTLYAGVFAAVLAWAVHTGIDWDWEMPALTAGFFALGGAALAAHRRSVVESWAPQGLRVALGAFLLATAIAPGLVLASQRQLNAAVDAEQVGNCARAVNRATASISTLSIRPEPYEVLGICQARNGRRGLALQAMEKAEKNEPGNWRYAYDVAVLQGGVGQDPRPELFKARSLDRHEPQINDLIATLPKGEAPVGVDWELDLAAPSGATGRAQP